LNKNNKYVNQIEYKTLIHDTILTHDTITLMWHDVDLT